MVDCTILQVRRHKNLSAGTGSEAYQGDSARSGRAGTKGPKLKTYETWGAEERIRRTSGCPAPPGIPGDDEPVILYDSCLEMKFDGSKLPQMTLLAQIRIYIKLI